MFAYSIIYNKLEGWTVLDALYIFILGFVAAVRTRLGCKRWADNRHIEYERMKV